MDNIARIERRLKLQDLRVLMVVVEAGSMSKAAEQLATSQPAVSKTIADLERVLGLQLLDRGPQGVTPTPYGLALIKRSVVAFDELRSGVKDLLFLADPTVGDVRIAALPALASGFVAETIKRFKRKYSGVTCHLTVDEETARSYRRLEQREIDMCIRFFLPPVKEDRMDTQMLYADPLVVVAAANNPLARRRRIDLAELMKEPWVLAPPTSLMGGPTNAAIFRAAGFELPTTSILCTSGTPRMAMVAGERYLTIVPESTFRFTSHDMAIKALPVRDLPSIEWHVCIVTLKNRTLTPAAQRFVDCAQETVRLSGRSAGAAPRSQQKCD